MTSLRRAATQSLMGLTALLWGSGCILCSEGLDDFCIEVFNECETDPGELLGQLAVELDLRKPTVRTREAAAGNLVADAFYYTANKLCGGSVPCPDAAVQNGGGIRNQTACGERDIIPVGPFYEGDANQMLPFGNELVVLEISGWDLKLALEHSVDQLGLTGKAGQAGHFLQLSRLRIGVDCTQPAHALDSNQEQITQVGTRIASLEIQDSSGTWGPVDLDPPPDDTKYNIAMSGFIGAGGDGFVALVVRDASEKAELTSDGEYLTNPMWNIKTEGGDNMTDAEALAYYIRDKETVAPDIVGRIGKTSCTPGAD